MHAVLTVTVPLQYLGCTWVVLGEGQGSSYMEVFTATLLYVHLLKQLFDLFQYQERKNNISLTSIVDYILQALLIFIR